MAKGAKQLCRERERGRKTTNFYQEGGTTISLQT